MSQASLCRRPKLVSDLVQVSNNITQHQDSKDASTSEFFFSFFFLAFFLFLFSFLLFLCDFFSAPLPFTLFSQKVPQYRDKLKLDRSQRNSRRYTCTFSNLNTKRTRRLLEIQETNIPFDTCQIFFSFFPTQKSFLFFFYSPKIRNRTTR